MVRKFFSKLCDLNHLADFRVLKHFSTPKKKSIISSLSSSLLFCCIFSLLICSCLVFHLLFRLLFSLCRLSLSLPVSVSVCCCCCCGVLLCVVSWCVCAMWCGTLKTPPCIRSKRPRVCRHHAHGDVLNVYTGTFGIYTRVASEGSSSVLLTKICPRKDIACFRSSPQKPLDLSHFQV